MPVTAQRYFSHSNSVFGTLGPACDAPRSWRASPPQNQEVLVTRARRRIPFLDELYPSAAFENRVDSLRLAVSCRLPETGGTGQLRQRKSKDGTTPGAGGVFSGDAAASAGRLVQ